MYSKTASSDLSTVLPLTETSGGKPPCLAHSAHALLSGAEQLKAAPSFPVAPALSNKARLEVSSPLQPGPHRRPSRRILEHSRTLNLLSAGFHCCDPALCASPHSRGTPTVIGSTTSPLELCFHSCSSHCGILTVFLRFYL